MSGEGEAFFEPRMVGRGSPNRGEREEAAAVASQKGERERTEPESYGQASVSLPLFERIEPRFC